MAYYNPTMGIGQEYQAAPTGIAGLLGDRNFLQLLAGIGQNMDPKGAGGIIGGPARVLIASQAAQERAAQTSAAQNAQTKMVIDALNQHGGLTPKDTPGVTSIGATPEGVKMEITPPAAGAATPSVAPQYGGSGLETYAPTVPVATAPTVVPPTAPVAPVAPTAVAPTAPVVDPTTPGSSVTTINTRDRVNQLLPFYSALLGVPRVR